MPGVIGSARGLVGPVAVNCDWLRQRAESLTSISVWQYVQLAEQIRPGDTLTCCWDVKRPTNQPSQLVLTTSARVWVGSSLRRDLNVRALVWRSLSPVFSGYSAVILSVIAYRLVGLVVKASASRAEDPGSNPARAWIFFKVDSYQ